MTIFAFLLFTFALLLFALVAWFARRARPFAEQIIREAAQAKADLAAAEECRRVAIALNNDTITKRMEMARGLFYAQRAAPTVTEEERFLLDLLRGYESVMYGSELLFVPRGFPVERVMGVQKGLTQ